MTTFKELDKDSRITKKLKKSGLSMALIFSKEDIKRFNLEYDDEIDLSQAEIIKNTD